MQNITPRIPPFAAIGLLTGLIVAIAGCAGRSDVRGPDDTADPSPAHGTNGIEATHPAEPEVDAIALAAIDHSVQRAVEVYGEAVDEIAAGDEVAGERRMVVARGILESALDECSLTTGCEPQRLLDSYDRMLAAQAIALKQQSARVRELEEQLAEETQEPGTASFTPSVRENDTTVAALHGTDLDQVITLNEPVQAALDDWLTWMRPLLMESWRNYQYLRPRIGPIYQEAGLPEALLFGMIATETGGRTHSYSHAGAAGLLQFIRSTGRAYGLEVVDGFDTRLDPEAATRANVRYMNDRFAEFGQNLEKALAAYNGGENRMRRLDRKYRNVGFWDTRVYYAFPRETREYVPRVMAAAWLYLHPEDYNVEFPEYETTLVDLTIERDASLGEMTICLGQADDPGGWFRVLRNLNPRLEPAVRIPQGDVITVPAPVEPIYHERCLSGDVLARATALHDANYPPEGAMVDYVVESGDTLGRIASRHSCVSIGELADINQVRAPRYTIRVGQVLKIPSCS